MAPTSALLALAAAMPLAFAAPATEVEPRGFSINQQETGTKKYLSGPMAMLETYEKYHVPVPDNVRSAAIAAQSGSVTATPEQYDSSYLCPVTIGTPGVTLNMDFDTGSSDFWVFSSELPASERSGHSYYTPGSSSSSRLDSGETWSIEYEDGSGSKGNVYFDKVVIGSVTATSQAVECATSVSSQFVDDTDNDGLVGLAFDSINTGTPTRLLTFMNNVGPTLPSPIFCADLKYHAAGVYDFGFIDTTKFTGALTYVNVNDANGFWEFSAGGYEVGSKSYTTSLGNCIADTGTTLIYVPKAAVKNYYAQVSGAQNNEEAGGYIFPCSATLPSFSVVISGTTHTVPGEYMNYAPYSGSECFGGIQSSAGIGFNILGDVFLKSQYVVFDTSVPRLGFANQS